MLLGIHQHATVIRRRVANTDPWDVALPGQLFFTTQIPVCLWFVDRNKASSSERDRRAETLFVDARGMGQKISRTQIELTEDEIARITGTYHAWRGQPDTGEYADEPGFCKAATLAEVKQAGFALTPGRYVGAAVEKEDEAAFEEQMRELVAQLREDVAESERLALIAIPASKCSDGARAMHRPLCVSLAISASARRTSCAVRSAPRVFVIPARSSTSRWGSSSGARSRMRGVG